MDYSKIKFLFLDVDGTLTDGKIYMSDSGELFKAFDVKDGCGIKDILPKLGIKPVIITARSSKILLNRCKELSIDMVFQNTRDKVSKIKEIMNAYGYSLNSEGVYESDDVVVEVWRGLAETVSASCKIGDYVGINGRIHSRKYQKDDRIYLNYGFVAEKVDFLR